MAQSLIEQSVRSAVAKVQITDLHTHLYDPAFGPLLLRGLDEMLCYHYLVAEAAPYLGLSYDALFGLSKPQMAEKVWHALFIERSPLSEAARGLLTNLKKLGLSGTKLRDLDAARAAFAVASSGDHASKVLKAAGLRDLVMTNDPFDVEERKVWERGFKRDPRFHAALRLDSLLDLSPAMVVAMKGMGYKVKLKPDASSLAETRRYLNDWIARMKPLYLASSFSPAFDPKPGTPLGLVIEKAILPVALKHDLPFALMIGVRRQVNPGLRLAGDGLGRCDVTALESLCLRFPHNKFLSTVLSRENQQDLAVAGRSFKNLLVFGCWWYMNTPSLIRETTRMRFELLGLNFVPQHSDARVFEQLIYKWDHSRALVAEVLAEKYEDLSASGWVASPAEIQRDVEALFHGNFWDFLRRKL